MSRLNTLLLDQSAWDLVLDSARNIALATPPYALAQDVASAVRLFLGELWFDTSKGIPYWENVLGKLPPLALMISYIEGAAKTVPGVVSARCIITSFTAREVVGQVLFIDETGAENGVKF